MHCLYVATIALLLGLGSGCSTDKLLRIRSLNTDTDPRNSSESLGDFAGLKPLTATALNTNVVFIHGIGWTQEKGHEKGSSQFGDDLLRALSRAYPGSKKIDNKYECPTSSLLGRTERRGPHNGLTIIRSSELKPLLTDDPELQLLPREIGCLDRTVVTIGEGRTITVYRLLWDDAVWNGVEWHHMGYDDPIPTDEHGDKVAHDGYDDPDRLRASVNSQLKNSVVTYGLVDAALYMGPVGELLREGAEAAICVALSDSFEEARTASGEAKSHELCAKASGKKAPLLLVAHSLGSRILFDTIHTNLTGTLASRMSEGISNDEVELHMLANQLPLVGVGRLGQPRSNGRIPGKSLKLVAYSEINDLLTYELVPYFEHLYHVRCYGATAAASGCTQSAEDEYRSRAKSFFKTSGARKRLVKDLGFDVVDVRVQFAPNKFFIYSGLKDPAIAHSGHLESDTVLTLMFCGAKDGKPLKEGPQCFAR